MINRSPVLVTSLHGCLISVVLPSTKHNDHSEESEAFIIGPAVNRLGCKTIRSAIKKLKYEPSQISKILGKLEHFLTIISMNISMSTCKSNSV